MVVLTGMPARELRSRLPELVLRRAEQFFSDGYTDDDGCLVVVEETDKLDDFAMVTEGSLLDLFDPEWPAYELVECFVGDTGQRVWEVVVQGDDSRSVALFVVDAPWLDGRLRAALESVASSPV